MIVRDYEPRDLDACRALFEELLETHRALYPDAEIEDEFVSEGRLFVAEEDGAVVGYAGLSPARHPGGARADRDLVEEARRGGAVRVFVRPAARNRAAIGFFHELGFDTLGYVQLQLDIEPRERRRGDELTGRRFKI
jgi:L-amino acid N-acyltransferase YncA